MSSGFRDWILFPVRTRTRAALSVGALAVLVVAGWYGLGAWRFRRDLGAAREALARYDFTEARRRLRACLDRRPDDTPVLLLATQAARRDGLLDEAQQYLDHYQEQAGGTTPEGALQWALIQVQRGRVKEHVHTLIDYVEVRHPESEQILEALAQGCVHVYRLDEATFWTRLLLERFPDNPVGRLIDAQTNESLRRREQSLEMTRRLVEDYPGNDKARLYLAGLLLKRHKYNEAAEHFREVHRRRPAELMPLLGLTRIMLTLGRVEEARPLLRQLEEEHGDNADALLECARFALRENRPADAEPLLRRALRIAPNDHEVHLELAVSLRQLNRPDEAQRHVERYNQIQADLISLDKAFQAMVKSPSDPAPRLEAGRICLRNGQVTEGLRWLFGVLELVPGHKPTHKLLAEHFESAGDKSRAEHHRAKAR